MGRKLVVFICWLLMLQTMNLSINPGRHLNRVNGLASFREDVRINQIESICELVLEFAFDTDVPENQDADEDPAGKILLTCLEPAQLLYERIAQPLAAPPHPLYTAHLPEHIENLESPPPEGRLFHVAQPRA